MPKEEEIDFDAGITLNKKTNDSVEKGDVIFTLYSSKEIDGEIIDYLNSSFSIDDNKAENKIILEKI